MALTNDQITAQNFKDFYDQIYPYLGQGGEGGTGGHTIQDDGVDMTSRDNLNFVGMEVDDNDSDGSTDVAEHRLTSAEISEMMGGIPNPTPRYPVIADERGTEYQVGWYILTNGTKQPVYQKTIDCGNLPNNATKQINHGITNRSLIVSAMVIGCNPNTGGVIQLPYMTKTGANIATYDVTSTQIELYTNYNASGGHVYATLQYTKTTDTPV